ncbi:hypothetical protein Agub_g9363, partial [Astrephomene gubernaculifera]
VQVTAVAFVGPLMVATGTDRGDICVYDISTFRMEAVQRFHADEGHITTLAVRLTPRQAHDTATAAAPRGLDGGGVVSGPMGLPWRTSPSRPAGMGAGLGGLDASEQAGTDTLLAAASSAGGLHVFRAEGAGEHAWRHVHTGAVAGQPFLSYSPDGDYLAVGSGAHGGHLVVLDANTLQVVLEQPFPGSRLAGAGFLPAAAGGSQLVAVPRGGTLAGGVRLRLYAAPARGMPALIELTRPLREPHTSSASHGSGWEAQVAEGEDFLAWLERAANAPPAAASQDATAATAAGSRVPELSPIGTRFARGGAAGSGGAVSSPLAHVRGSPLPADRRRSPEAWAAALGLGFGAGGTGGDSGNGGGSWLAADAEAEVRQRGSLEVEPWASPAGGRRVGAALATTAATLGAEEEAEAVVAFAAAAGDPSRATVAKVASVGVANRGGGGGGASAAAAAGAVAAGLAVVESGACAGAEAEAGSPARTWQAQRPSTQPAARSWITGGPPRTDFLPQPTAPTQGTSTMSRNPAPAPPSARHAAAAAASKRTHLVTLGAGCIDEDAEAEAAAVQEEDEEGAEGEGEGLLSEEPELPHSGTLLPASGIPAAKNSASSSRYAAAPSLYDEDEQEAEMEAEERPRRPLVQGRSQEAPLGRAREGGQQHQQPPLHCGAAAGGAQAGGMQLGGAAGGPGGWLAGREDAEPGVEATLGGAGGDVLSYGGGADEAGGGLYDSSWREGDLTMTGPQMFGSSLSAAGRGAGSSLTHGSAGGDDSLSTASFHFQMPSQQQQRQQQQQPLLEETARLNLGPSRDTALAGGQRVSSPEPKANDPWVGGNSNPYLHGYGYSSYSHSDAAGAAAMDADYEGAGADPLLARTAYFSADQLASDGGLPEAISLGLGVALGPAGGGEDASGEGGSSSSGQQPYQSPWQQLLQAGLGGCG